MINIGEWEPSCLFLLRATCCSVPKDLTPKLTELSVQMRAILQEVQRCRAEALQRHDEQVREQKRQRAGRDGWIITMILAFIAGVLASQGMQSLI
jgi:hypothetical protein